MVRKEGKGETHKRTRNHNQSENRYDSHATGRLSSSWCHTAFLTNEEILGNGRSTWILVLFLSDSLCCSSTLSVPKCYPYSRLLLESIIQDAIALTVLVLGRI